MPVKAEYKEFRTLLRKAIGDNPQAVFARKAGISAQHLNRMLNNAEIHKPSIDTLRKIAGAAEDGVTLSELKAVCGYDSESETSAMAKRKELLPPQRARACIDDIKKGLDSMANDIMYRSLDEFIDSVLMLFAVEDISYRIMEPVDTDTQPDLENYAGKFGEKGCAVVMSFATPQFSVEFVFGVFYAESQRAVFITNVSFDSEALLLLGNDLALEADAEELDLGYIYKITPVRKKLPIPSPSFNDKLSPEEKLLKVIFSSDAPKRLVCEEGAGFYVTDIPQFVFDRFFENHKEALTRSNAGKKAYEKYLADGSSAFESFHSECGAGTGMWGAVCEIIWQETELKADYFEGDPSIAEGIQNKPCVMVPYRAPWLYSEAEKQMTAGSIYQILDRYALELRQDMTTGEVHFYTEIEED